MEIMIARFGNYYSSNIDDPDVYHNHYDCISGKQIPNKNLVEGTGGYRLCMHCSER